MAKHTPPLSRRDAMGAMALGAAGLSVGCAWAGGGRRSAEPSPSDLPGIASEFRGVWVATVDNIDWPSRPGLAPDRQRAETRGILDQAVACGLNSIILQVRPTADAIYPSRTEPWSAFLTGTQGSAPTPWYDPLAYWLEQAHQRGLDVHAWVNPFRVRHPKSIGPDAPSHVTSTHPELVRRVGPYLWLDPGQPAARGLALRAVRELLARYPVDGIHLDDYFYPYPRPDTPFPDERTHARLGNHMRLTDWRRDNINRFVQDLRTEVRRASGHRLLTISPFGIWRPDHPRGVRGFDAYEGLAADSRRWLEEGWCDALMPQLYWPVESSGQPFEPLLRWWVEQNRRDRHVWPGLFATRVKPAGEPESWSPDEIIRQIGITRHTPGATGVVLFSMVGLTENRRGMADRLRTELFSSRAAVPASPWAANARMGLPTATMEGGRVAVRAARRGLDARLWSLQRRTDSGWETTLVPASDDRPLAPNGRGPVWVRAIGPNGARSAAVST